MLLSRQKNATVDNNAYAHTLFLPKTSFPLRRDPAKEEPLRKRTCEDLYHLQWKQEKRPLFVFHDGPPYANGDLHMGHALNKILKDIINRYHVSIGDRVHYLPGWDCHGLPIENKVLKNIGKDVHEVPPMTIRKEAEAYAKDQVSSQQEQFKQLGVMAGWSTDTTYRTLDHEYEIRQLTIFQEMVKRGMIYRHFRPVHYSPSSHSALAEAELEYKDNHVSHSVYVSFDLDLSRKDAMHTVLRNLVESQTRVQLLVWTTTPWTLTANMAIAVNPEMKYTVMQDQQHPDAGVVIFATSRRHHLQEILDSMGLDTVVAELNGSDISNAFYRPLFAQLSGSKDSFPILPSQHVTPETGTGLVHCAPAHGQEDYALFHSLGLIDTKSPSSLVCHVDNMGKFTPQVSEVLGKDAGSLLVEKEVLYAGGKVMIKLLGEMGVLRKTEKIQHRYPYDWKTDKPVIILATSQWFANLDAIKDDAIAALKDVQFYPPQCKSNHHLHPYLYTRRSPLYRVN
ncbi:hypothetical protein NM688_g9264 [Phlebia brevispora]|uniref:Uncharacterized protein n=1 Tax=Phlebia brevispora TaxID=194682 RepID=A0ACC1RHK7_9APHY|nr:hypothetical protein NM688_g9264 [Phlebia brevispora]